MATKKFSFGSNDVSTTKKRSGGPSMGASRLPLGEGLDLRIPALQPKPNLRNTFLTPTKPNVTPAVVPQGSTVAKPSPDLENLANSLGNLNTNLKQFTTSFLTSEKIKNEEAENRAEAIAIKLSKTNGNLMGDYNKLLERFDRERTDPKLSATQQSLAEENYNTLKSLDPRASDFLARSLEYQKGLTLIANAPIYIENLTSKDGSPLIPKPYTEDGKPSELDLILNKYYLDNGITDPGVMLDLRDLMVNTSMNIKRQAAQKYAIQNDEIHKDAFQYSIDNNIGELYLNNTTDQKDKYIPGTLFTQSFDTVFTSGMTSKSRSLVEENLQDFLVDSILKNSYNPKTRHIDTAKLEIIRDLVINELNATKTGPIGSEDRPLLIKKLGPTFEAELRNKLNAKQTKIRFNNKERTTLYARGNETDLFNEALESFSDSDIETEGRQPYLVNIGTEAFPLEIEYTVNLQKIIEYRNERYAEIGKTGSLDEQRARKEILDDLIEVQLTAMTQNRDVAYLELKDFVDDFNIPAKVKMARVEHAGRYKLISPSHYTILYNSAKMLVDNEGSQVQTIITGHRKDALEMLEDAAKGDYLGIDIGESPGNVTTNEQMRINEMLSYLTTESNRIWADKDDGLNTSKKIDAINNLWVEARNNFDTFNQEKIRSRSVDENNFLKWYNEKINGKQSDIQRNQIENGTVTIDKENPLLLDGQNKQFVITRRDGSEYRVDTSGLNYSDNQHYEEALSAVEAELYKHELLTEYYNRIVNDPENGVKPGETILMPDIERLMNDPDVNQAFKAYVLVGSPLTGVQRMGVFGNKLSPEILDKMYNDIDLLIEKAELANNTPYQFQIHWTDFSSEQVNSRGERNNIYIPVQSKEYQSDAVAIREVERLSRTETMKHIDQKFRGIYITDFQDPSDIAINTMVGFPADSYLNNYYKIKNKELKIYHSQGYDYGSGIGERIDPAAPKPGEITPEKLRGTLFAETPFHIVERIGEGRGNLNDTTTIEREMTDKALYEKYIFVEQLNAMANQAPWIPYALDLNVILKKTKTQPLDFFLKQYKVHMGQEMPAELQEDIIKRLSTRKIEGHRTMQNPLFRKELLNRVNNEKDQALILDIKDNQLITNSWVPQQGTLIAGELTPGLLASLQDGQKISPRLSKNRNIFLDSIHMVESTNGGYEAFNQRGTKDGTEVKGFSGIYGEHPANKGKKLVNLTIQEILDIQDSGYDFDKYPNTAKGDAKWDASGGIHAAGRYQMTRGFIRDALRYSGIDPNTKFTPEIQDQLAIAYVLGMKLQGEDLGETWKGFIRNEETKKFLPKAIEALKQLNTPDPVKKKKKKSDKIDPSSDLA